MCDLMIDTHEKAALEYMANTKQQRDLTAKRVKDARATMFAAGLGLRALPLAKKVLRLQDAPPKVTQAWIESEIEQYTPALTATCPDYTLDDGYSRCGMEDAWYEYRDGAIEWLKTLKAMKAVLNTVECTL